MYQGSYVTIKIHKHVRHATQRTGCGRSAVHDRYDGRRMRPEKLAAWRALRERYGNRDESRVDRGTLVDVAA
jgi:hypothetical protein